MEERLFIYSHSQIRVDTLIFYYILSINPSSPIVYNNEVDESMDMKLPSI